MAAAHDRYLSTLTPLRGIAALWVLLAHIDAVVVPLLPADATGLFTKGYLWVDFFFLLSGFVICHSYGARISDAEAPLAVRDYILGRFARLYPLHLFTLAAFVVAAELLLIGWPALVHTHLLQTMLDGRLLVINLLLGQSFGLTHEASWNVLSWSVAAEWWTYVAAAPLLSFLYAGSARRHGLVALICCAGLFTLAAGKGHLNLTYDFGFLRCIFEFTLGVTLYELYRTGRGRSLLRRDGVIATAASAVLLLLHYEAPDILLIPAFGLLVIAAASNNGWAAALLARRPFQQLGRISYSIYMVQGVWLFVYLTGFSIAEWEGVAPPNAVTAYAFAAALVALTLGSAALTYRYVERPAQVRWRPLAEQALAHASLVVSAVLSPAGVPALRAPKGLEGAFLAIAGPAPGDWPSLPGITFPTGLARRAAHRSGERTTAISSGTREGRAAHADQRRGTTRPLTTRARLMYTGDP